MNEPLQKPDLNIFDSIKSENENINLKTIIIPGLTIESELENSLAQIEFNGNKIRPINDETIIESAEDIFIFTEPAYVAKKQTHSEFTQIPTSFESENRNRTTDKIKCNIFLKNEEDVVTHLQQKTTSTVVSNKKATSTNRVVKQHYHSQKSYSFAITMLFLLIVASALFVLHLNNTINLHQITFDLYENTKTILSSHNKSDLIKGWDSFIHVAKVTK